MILILVTEVGLLGAWYRAQVRRTKVLLSREPMLRSFAIRRKHRTGWPGITPISVLLAVAGLPPARACRSPRSFWNFPRRTRAAQRRKRVSRSPFTCTGSSSRVPKPSSGRYARPLQQVRASWAGFFRKRLHCRCTWRGFRARGSEFKGIRWSGSGSLGSSIV